MYFLRFGGGAEPGGRGRTLGRPGPRKLRVLGVSGIGDTRLAPKTSLD